MEVFFVEFYSSLVFIGGWHLCGALSASAGYYWLLHLLIWVFSINPLVFKNLMNIFSFSWCYQHF